MTSRISLDTYSLRIRELLAINPATLVEVVPDQILYTSSLGELLWTSTVQLLSSVQINGETAYNIAQTVQPGLSTVSTATDTVFQSTTSSLGGSIANSNNYVNNLPISSILVSTTQGLGGLGYVSSTNVQIPSFTTYELILKQDNPSTVITDMFIANCIDYGSSMWMMGGQMNSNATTSTGIIKRSFNGFQWESLSTNCFTRVNDIKFITGYQTGTLSYLEFWLATGYTNGTPEETVQVSLDGGNSWISTVAGGPPRITEGFVIASNFTSSVSSTEVFVGGTTGVGSVSNLYYTPASDLGWTSTNNWGVDYTLSTFTTIYDIQPSLLHASVNEVVGNSFGLPLGTYTFYIPGNGYQVSSIYFDKIYGIANDLSGNQMALGHLGGLDDIYIASNFGSGWELGPKILNDGEKNVIKYLNGFWLVGGTGGLKANATGDPNDWVSVPQGLETVRDIVWGGEHYIIVGKPSTLTIGSNSKSVLISPYLSSFVDADVTITSTILTVSSGILLADNQNPIQQGLITSTVKGLGTVGYLSSFLITDSIVTSTLGISSFSLLQSTPQSLFVNGISTVYALEYDGTKWLAGGSSGNPFAPVLNVSSNDGLTWTSLAKVQAISTVRTIAHNAYADVWWTGGFINSAVSTGTVIGGDPSLTFWASQTDANLRFVDVRAIWTDSNSLVTFIGGYTNGTVNPYNLIYFDGTNYNPNYVKNLIQINTIRYNEGNIYIGGLCDPVVPITSTIGNLQVSYNFGITWDELQAPLSKVFDVGFHNGRMIAIGTDLYGADALTTTYSDNGGYSWNVGTQFALTNQEAPRILYYKGQWIIAASQIQRSSDNGINWTAAEPTTFTNVNALQSNTRQVLAGGNQSGANLLLQSVDGVNWSTSVTSIVSTQVMLSTNSLFINDSPAVNITDVVSTIDGLGTTGYVSTLSPTYEADLTSTVAGLGSAGYLSSFNTSSFYNDFTVSTLQIFSIEFPANYTLRADANQNILLSMIGYTGEEPLLLLSSMQSTIDGLGQSGFVSTGGFPAWYNSIGSSNYISTSQLQSTVLNNLNLYMGSYALTSTVDGLGSAGYISTTLTSEQYICRTSTLAFEGELQSTTTFDSTINISTIRVNLSSFSDYVTSQTTMRLDFKTNIGVTYGTPLQENMKFISYLTYEDDTTQCGTSLEHIIQASNTSFFIPNVSFVLTSADVTTTYPSTLSLHHSMSTGTDDQGIFKNLTPSTGTIKVLLNNI